MDLKIRRVHIITRLDILELKIHNQGREDIILILDSFTETKYLVSVKREKESFLLSKLKGTVIIYSQK